MGSLGSAGDCFLSFVSSVLRRSPVESRLDTEERMGVVDSANRQPKRSAIAMDESAPSVLPMCRSLCHFVTRYLFRATLLAAMPFNRAVHRGLLLSMAICLSSSLCLRQQTHIYVGIPNQEFTLTGPSTLVPPLSAVQVVTGTRPLGHAIKCVGPGTCRLSLLKVFLLWRLPPTPSAGSTTNHVCPGSRIICSICAAKLFAFCAGCHRHPPLAVQPAAGHPCLPP